MVREELVHSSDGLAEIVLLGHEHLVHCLILCYSYPCFYNYVQSVTALGHDVLKIVLWRYLSAFCKLILCMTMCSSNKIYKQCSLNSDHRVYH